LHEHNDRLTTVLANMDEGVIAVDASQRIWWANPSSRLLLGFTAPEVIGRPLLEASRHRSLHEAVDQALTTRRSVHTEFDAPGPPRRALALRANCLPGEPPPGVVLVLHDVSELRRLENLRQEFVANVSHELKTPLAAIKAYAETLRLGAIHDAEHSLEFVARIEEQAERLHQLILDLLQIARVESGREALEISRVSLAGVVGACAAHFAKEAEAKNIVLTVEPPDHSVVVRADAHGVRTILDNLVDNALKYTPPGGRVAVRWRSDAEVAVLEVQDTGIGISEKDQARVFERFYRVDKARSRELGGTGLGLSIVKHLAQALGGSVSLQSALGQGCTIVVRLPLAN
jgi:two-component system phosphate regulon sensor histidine kinase PhoR